MGEIIQSGEFGWWCESNDEIDFTQKVDEAINSNLTVLGENAFSYLSKHYTVNLSYEKIIDCFSKEKI
jgi:hypothetical protein